MPTSALADSETANPTPKVVVLGEPAVGKTSLIWTLAGREIGKEFPATVGIDEQHETAFASFLDVPGAIPRKNIAEQLEEHQPDAALFVLESSDHKPLNNLDYWYKIIELYSRHTTVPKFLVITKCDNAPLNPMALSSLVDK